jgi:hypothetical protein
LTHVIPESGAALLRHTVVDLRAVHAQRAIIIEHQSVEAKDAANGDRIAI